MNSSSDEPSRLKQRLVGASVLIAIMIIFLPMILLDESENNEVSMDELVPPSPYGMRDDILTKDEVTFPVDLEAPIPLPEDTQRNIKNELDRASKLVEEKKEIEKAVDDTQHVTLESISQSAEPKSTKKTTKPSIKKKPPVKHWAVQVGSFSDPKNAIALRDKLRKQGYSVFIEKHRDRNKNSLRVRVGPMVKKSQAQATQKALETKQKIEGIITAYP